MDGQTPPPKPNRDNDYRAAGQALDDREWPEYGAFKPPRTKTPKNKEPFIIIALVIIALLIIGGVVLLITHHHSPTNQATDHSSNGQPAPASNSKSSGTSQYVSNGQDLNLSFSYPTSWTVTPASNNNAKDHTITLTSPLTAITTATGSKVTGKVTVTIRPGTTTPNELNNNNPLAAQTSTQFAYTQPAASQYQYPYLTYIHFSTGAKTADAFEEVMITGTTQFTQNEAMTAGDLTGLDPIISATFTTCTTKACTGSGAKPLSITNNTWTNAAIFKQVQALFASLKLN